jgi:ferrous iron transport protein A
MNRSREMTRLTLADLAEGSSACIEHLEGHEEVLDQFRELGLCEGEDVTVKKIAPLRDPIIVEVLNYRLSIRKGDARGIFVTPLS